MVGCVKEKTMGLFKQAQPKINIKWCMVVEWNQENQIK